MSFIFSAYKYNIQDLRSCYKYFQLRIDNYATLTTVIEE